MNTPDKVEEMKDTGVKYANGDRMLEGDDVIFQFSRCGGGAMDEKVECTIVYKNAAFYVVSKLNINDIPALEKTIASVLENNAQVPRKHPMNMIKITPSHQVGCEVK